MRKVSFKDFFEFFLVAGLLYVIDFGLISNYLPAWDSWFPGFLPNLPLWSISSMTDSPFHMLNLFFMGILLYILLMGEITGVQLGKLSLGVLLLTILFWIGRWAFVVAACYLRDVTFVGTLTWSYVLVYALPIWLYGYLFGGLLHLLFDKKRPFAKTIWAPWRWAWLAVSIGAAVLYQKSIEFSPHTRLMDFQIELAKLVYLFLPLASIFWDILRFRAGRQAGEAKPAEPLSQPAETPSDSHQ